MVAIGEKRDEPVRVSDAMAVIRTRWTALGIIVLRAAIDKIERSVSSTATL